MTEKERLANEAKMATLQGKLDYNLRTLKDRALDLSAQMQRLADRIDREGENAMINSLGEIQGRGEEIDLMCATISTLKEIKSFVIKYDL